MMDGEDGREERLRKKWRRGDLEKRRELFP